MSFSRYFFEQNREQIKKEGKLYKARVESREIDKKKCKHKDVTLTGGQLSCKCGARWTGSGVGKLYKLLKS